MEGLLTRQNELWESINKIKTNFGKDAASRKTSDYIQKRLESLDALWGEFELNHSKISANPGQSYDYFEKNVFNQVQELYQTTRLLLSSYGKEEKGTQPSGKVDELLVLQRTHFRCLIRQIGKIDVGSISDKWELEDELRNIQGKWSVIDNLHVQIDNILQGGDISYEEEYTSHETAYKALKRALHQKISSMVHTQHATPQLDIPTFTGKYSQWPTFYDLFSEAIHQNNCLTKAQKMQHLKGKLKGEAERLIQHLHISADNYDTAWDILNHRYNNPQALFSNQIEIFLNQPNVTKQTSYELKRLYDTTTECIHSISNLGVDTNSWDPLLVHLLCKKLDPETYSDYKEARQAPRELPTLGEFLSFIEGKFVALEPIVHQTRKSLSQQPTYQKFKQPISNNTFSQSKPNNGNFQKRYFQARTTYTVNCPVCNLRHDLFSCRKFKNMTPVQRLTAVTKAHYCINCLYRHNGAECISTKRCKECQADHNTLLHDAFIHSSPSPSSPTAIMPSTSTRTALPQSQSKLQNAHNIHHVASDCEEILLTTVTLNVLSQNGNYITLRALLDQGSQISLISENATHLLGLQRRQYHASISGIGPVSKQSRGIVSLDCQSIYGDYQLQTQALVVASVINNLPNSSFKQRIWPHLQHLKLADPAYNVSRPIDILLDASVYSEIIMSGLVKGPSQAPIAQQTKLGWILSGNVKTFNCFVVLNNLDEISKYWEMEDISETSTSLTRDEQYCEQFYQQTTRRLESGSYEVGLPMKPDYEQEIGLSKAKAVAQFIKLERQMCRDKSFSEEYKKFIYEYQALGHMHQVNNVSKNAIILPQHGVWKMDSNTTKLRVVFNASSKTTSGKSLNDLMYCGPNLQKDLLTLILNWRKYKYVLTADIEKMFRMIMVRSSDQHLQSIIWRDSPDETFRTFYLSTITQGTSAAPFLAMRTLKQLAEDDESKYPLASSAVKSSFFMDDLLTGANSISKARELLQQLILMFLGAGMNLRRWSSNNQELLKDLPSDQLNSPYEFKCSETRKTLGLIWNPSSDTFVFSSKISNDSKSLTKRELLSEISKLFDPLGWLSPLTIRAKLLFQKAWSSGVAWDDYLSDIIQNDWLHLKHDIQNINNIGIPRYIGSTEVKNHLHAFCDASDKAYSCAIYLVTKQDKGDYTSRLIVAKTKLAPLSKKVSLPRLELCGALLLSQLIAKVQESIVSHNTTIYAWTDSMVVLGWLKGDCSRWKTFVANRVQKITSIIPPSCWHHVRSEENAADCATRGLTAAQLINFSLWWEGPSWLKHFEEENIKHINYQSPTIEIKSSVHTALNHNNHTFITDLLLQHSSLTRVIKIVCWISRFIKQLRDKQKSSYDLSLTSSELESAYNLIIRDVQKRDFHDDIDNIKRNGHVHSKSRIYSLNPYIDDQGLLRVGGRLANAHLSLSAKHPIILSNKGRLTDLIIDHAHLNTLHGGPRLTLAYIRDKCWILSGIRTVKQKLRMCVKCRRYNHDSRQPIMADLPQARVTPSRPFTHTGVDFTGHVELKANKGRGIKTLKGYISVFICLATKAVHLELVTDLSTTAFIAAFRRFCSRRGTPSHVYSDNGTNFVGADRVLKKEYLEIVQTINNSDFLRSIGDLDIQWHRNAPAYPNAGGLWEAAVRSLKYHLKRVLGDQKLTYEEFTTLLCQIEACLNSRPLCQLTENADDDYLSPGHFLIGGPILSRPHTEQHALTYHSRWQLVQSLMKDFWKKWSSEYLQQLQARTKWRKPCQNLNVNDIVLIKAENLPPGQWPLARIQELHPGKDGQVRVVTLKTSKNIIQRPVNKLVLLPVCTQPYDVKQPATENDTRNEQSSSSSVRRGNQNNNNTRPRRFATLKSFFLSILLLFTLITSSLQQQSKPFNITQIEPQQGFYFDKISDLQLIRDEWKLVVFYNMTAYWSGISDIHNYINSLHNTTEGAGAQYGNVIYQLSHEIKEIEHYNIVLKHHSTNRHRRGLINGVGYVANTLFGVLDERFAEQYNQDIKRIAQNENHLQALLKNQTSILEVEYSILRRNEGIMNKQFAYLNQHLRNVSAELDQVRIDNKNGEYIMSSALAANIIISSLRRIQQALVDTVTDISQGKVNMHILSPEQLERQIRIISSHLQGNTVVPVEMSSLSDLYKIMKASARIHKDYLIIEIKIPLLSSEKYELDSIITIPYQRDLNHSLIISTTLPYIAYNIQKDTALLLSDSDIKTCIHVSSSRKLICSFNKPIYNLKLKQSLCDLKPVSREPVCYHDVVNCRDQWHKLHNPNSWFYSCCDVCRLRIFCLSDVTMISLKGNGIVYLEEGCTLKSEYFSIYAHNNFVQHLNIKPNIEAPEVSILNTFVNTSTSEEFKHSDDRNVMWNQLRDQITDLKEQSSTNLSIHDVHHYSITYIMVIIFVALGGILGYKYMKARCHRALRGHLGASGPAEGSQPAGGEASCVAAVSAQCSESVIEMVDLSKSKSVLSVDKETCITPVSTPRPSRTFFS